MTTYRIELDDDHVGQAITNRTINHAMASTMLDQLRDQYRPPIRTGDWVRLAGALHRVLDIVDAGDRRGPSAVLWPAGNRVSGRTPAPNGAPVVYVGNLDPASPPEPDKP